MHAGPATFFGNLKLSLPECFRKKRVLEVGSLDINGSLRGLFDECEYLGVDLAPGKGVDLVSHGHLLTFPDRHFDVCISSECFEHDRYWKETFLNMVRMSKTMVAFSCAGPLRAEHGTTRTSPADSPFTNDYYENRTRQDFEALDLANDFNLWEFYENQMPSDLFFVGMRKAL